MNESKIEHYQSILPEVAKRSSEMERRADEAERETIKLKKTEYMQAHIGEEFDGVISGITKWGMYVELPNTIEGLVHVTNMTDDHYEYNEERYEMIGMHTRKVYKLGEALRVQVLDADRLMRTIDFKIVNQGRCRRWRRVMTRWLQIIKRHIMIILSWIRSRQELLCTEQK